VPKQARQNNATTDVKSALIITSALRENECSASRSCRLILWETDTLPIG